MKEVGLGAARSCRKCALCFSEGGWAEARWAARAGAPLSGTAEGGVFVGPSSSPVGRCVVVASCATTEWSEEGRGALFVVLSGAVVGAAAGNVFAPGGSAAGDEEEEELPPEVSVEDKAAVDEAGDVLPSSAGAPVPSLA